MRIEIDGQTFRGEKVTDAILREARKAEIQASVTNDAYRLMRLERRAKNLKRIVKMIDKREVKIDDKT